MSLASTTGISWSIVPTLSDTMRIVIIVLMSSAFLTAFVVDAVLNDGDRAAALALHNQIRSNVSPPALNMLALNWDANLEASAQAYANTCPTGHSSTPYGENLAWGWPVMNITDGISAWASESQWYELSNLTCASGKVCGHYTQMVWANTQLIGCGHAICPGLFGRDQVQVYVCHYASAGNWAGMAPYAAGTACGWCPAGYACNDQKLCAKIGTFTTAPTVSPAPITRRPRPAAETPIPSPSPSTTSPSAATTAPNNSSTISPASSSQTPIPTTSTNLSTTSLPAQISTPSSIAPTTIPTNAATASASPSTSSSSIPSPMPTSSASSLFSSAPTTDIPIPTMTVIFSSVASASPSTVSPTSLITTPSPSTISNSPQSSNLLESIISAVADQTQNFSVGVPQQNLSVAILSSSTSSPPAQNSTAVASTPRPRRISIV